MKPAHTIDPESLIEIRTADGASLIELSHEQPLMMVFLRHLACVFCREALEDISKARHDLEKLGFRLVFVHMEDLEMGSTYLEKYELADCIHIADPECDLYSKFGLVKGSFTQLMGFQTLVKGFSKGIDLGQFGGKAFGDAFQMPGIFCIRDGRIEAEFVHDQVWERPDYVDLAKCCTTMKQED